MRGPADASPQRTCELHFEPRILCFQLSMLTLSLLMVAARADICWPVAPLGAADRLTWFARDPVMAAATRPHLLSLSLIHI